MGHDPQDDFYWTNAQFRETEDERAARWRAVRAKRKAEGKCWQCAKAIADCSCPNVSHAHPDTETNGAGGGRDGR